MNKLSGSLLGLIGMMVLPAFAAVNINTATQSELEAVRGLGPAKAKAIISYRDANGGFKSLDELPPDSTADGHAGPADEML